MLKLGSVLNLFLKFKLTSCSYIVVFAKKFVKIECYANCVTVSHYIICTDILKRVSFAYTINICLLFQEKFIIFLVYHRKNKGFRANNYLCLASLLYANFSFCICIWCAMMIICDKQHNKQKTKNCKMKLTSFCI